MSVREKVLARLETALSACEAEGLWPAELRPALGLERPRQAEHGDLATNVAMTLARAAKRNPREIAQAIVSKLAAGPEDPVLTAAEIAGPGFINLRVSRDLFFEEIARAAAQGEQFGRSPTLDGQNIIVEFVSANPTGPMHVGHGRGAVTGDVIARLLDAAGAKVHREYYVNDAGVQVGHLAHAVYVRAKELVASEQPNAGVEVEPLGADDYKGEYIVDIARAVLDELSPEERLALVKAPFEQNKDLLKSRAVDIVMRTMIRPDLELFNISFDRYFSEQSLHDSNAIAKGLEELERRGVAAMEVLPPPKGMERDPDAPENDEPLLVMKTTRFGDDADRALRKPDGSYTYFAGDVAYHWDKLERGYSRIIDVWGADHGGYVKRVRSAIEALGGKPDMFDVVLVQMVNLLRDGQPVRMGKRSGNFVTLREVIEEAGADATRVFFLMRSSQSQLDFDLALATKQTEENPVFYVQYGHARAASILRKAAERGIEPKAITKESFAGLSLPEELDLVQRLLSFPDVVAGAAQALEPHRIVFFLQETIATFHGYLTRYKATEKVLSDDPVKTEARLALVRVLKQTLANALTLLGVSSPEQMTREAPTE